VPFCGAATKLFRIKALSPDFAMPITLNLVWLFALAIPIACVAWTVTHEEIFREPREYCKRECQEARSLWKRKFFYLFTCEFCFSYYITILFLIITRYKLLYQDWRGYLLALFALVWVANQYMSIYNRLRLDIKHEQVDIKVKEKEKDVQERKAA